MSCCNEPPPQDPPPPPGARMVKCAKFGKELPGLTWKPWNNALGQRVFESISENQEGKQTVKGTWTNIVRGV